MFPVRLNLVLTHSGVLVDGGTFRCRLVAKWIPAFLGKTLWTLANRGNQNSNMSTGRSGKLGFPNMTDRLNRRQDVIHRLIPMVDVRSAIAIVPRELRALTLVRIPWVIVLPLLLEQQRVPVLALQLLVIVNTVDKSKPRLGEVIAEDFRSARAPRVTSRLAIETQ